MKKYCFLSAVVVLGAMAASCNKEASSQEPVVNPQEKEEISVYDAPAFTASFAKNETKSYIGDAQGGYYQPLWDTTKDRVCINNGSMSAIVESEDDGLTASFLMSTESEYPEAPYCAVTPHNAFNKDHSTFDPETKTMKVMVAGTGAPQRYTTVNDKPTYYASAPIMAAYSEDGNFEFKNFSIFYKLTIGGGSDTDNIKTIYVRQGEGATTPNIAGQWNLQFNSADDITFAPLNLTALLAYDCGKEGIAQGTPIVITVPAYDFEDGLIFTIKDVNGHFASFKVASATAAAAGTVFTKTVAFSPASGQIRNADDWNAFAAAVNGEKNDWDLYRWVGNGTVQIAEDFEAEKLTQVRGKNGKFAYNVDGQGHTITLTAATQPIFRNLRTQIKDLTLAGALNSTNGNISAFVDTVYNGAVMTNCINEMSVNVNSTTDQHIIAGGIARIVLGGTFTSCVNKGAINCTKTIANTERNIEIGGLFAQVYNTEGELAMTNCSNEGTIYLKPVCSDRANGCKVFCVGGIAGWLRESSYWKTLKNCDNNGAITVDGSEICANGMYAYAVSVGGVAGVAAYLNSGAGAYTSTPKTVAGSKVKFDGCDNTARIYNGAVNYSTSGASNTKVYTGGIAGSFAGAPGDYAIMRNCTSNGRIVTYDLCGSGKCTRPQFCDVLGGVIGLGGYIEMDKLTVSITRDATSGEGLGNGKRPLVAIGGVIGMTVGPFSLSNSTVYTEGYFQRVAGYQNNRAVVACVPVKYNSTAMSTVPDVKGTVLTDNKLGWSLKICTATLSSATDVNDLSSTYNATITAVKSTEGVSNLVFGQGYTTYADDVTGSGNTNGGKDIVIP